MGLNTVTDGNNPLPVDPSQRKPTEGTKSKDSSKTGQVASKLTSGTQSTSTSSMNQKTVAQQKPGGNVDQTSRKKLPQPSTSQKIYPALPDIDDVSLKSHVHLIFCQDQPITKDELTGVTKESKKWLKRNEAFQAQVKEVVTLSAEDLKIAFSIQKTQGNTAYEKFIQNKAGEQLTDYIFKQPGGINRFTKLEQTHLFQQLFELDQLEAMDAMMSNSKYTEFKESPVNLELLARAALSHTPPNPAFGRYIIHRLIKHYTTELQTRLGTMAELADIHSLLSDAIEIQIAFTEDLLKEVQKKESDPNHQIDMKVYKEYKRAIGGTNCLNLEELSSTKVQDQLSTLHAAKLKTNKAFYLNFHPRNGCKLIAEHMQAGQFDEATATAKYLEHACLSKGVFEFTNPESAQGMLIACCLQGKQLTPEQYQHLCGILQENDNQEYLEATKDILKEFAAHSPNQATTTVLSLLDNTSQIKQAASGAKKLKDISFNYQGVTSNVIQGNFRFGGLLYSSYFNRGDRQQFDMLIREPLGHLIDRNRPESQVRIQTIESALGKPIDQLSLVDIEDPFIFLQITDLYIRQSFHNEELQMENLHSDGHKKFEQATNGLFNIAGMESKDMRKKVDGSGSPIPGSATSPSIALAIGLGDCRQHAQTKQLLFDVWRHARITSLLNEARTQELNGNSRESDQILEQVDNLSKLDLRTFDVIVKAQIEMVEKYQPSLTPSGEHKAASQVEEIEDHTMNFLFMGDKVYFADSFYQDHEFYQWGSGEVDLDYFKREGTIYAGDILARTASGTQESFPIQLEPTPYAGKRDQYNKGSENLMLLGIPTQFDDVIQATTVPQLGIRRANLDTFTQFA